MLEASDRLGGRANTQELDGLGRVELGATYFHGVVGNPLWDFAQEHKLEGLKPEPKGAFLQQQLSLSHC